MPPRRHELYGADLYKDTGIARQKASIEHGKRALVESEADKSDAVQSILNEYGAENVTELEARELHTSNGRWKQISSVDSIGNFIIGGKKYRPRFPLDHILNTLEYRKIASQETVEEEKPKKRKK